MLDHSQTAYSGRPTSASHLLFIYRRGLVVCYVYFFFHFSLVLHMIFTSTLKESDNLKKTQEM